MMIAKYTFNSNICADMMPVFSSEFTPDKYRVIDNIVNTVNIEVNNWIVSGIADHNGNLCESSEPSVERAVDFIEIDPNLTYTFNTNWVIVYAYDENHNFIHRHGAFGNATNLTKGPNCKLPSNAKYIRLKTHTDSLNCTITSQVTERIIEGIGENAPSIIQFGLDNDTTNSTNRELSLLTVEYVNTSNLNTMRRMFSYCTNVTYINSSDWDTSTIREHSSHSI